MEKEKGTVKYVSAFSGKIFDTTQEEPRQCENCCLIGAESEAHICESCGLSICDKCEKEHQKFDTRFAKQESICLCIWCAKTKGHLYETVPGWN
jgi:hypothetical protein